MAEWALSEKAAQDLEDIYVYTYGQFGGRQAEEYTRELEATLSMLVEQPGLGRRADDLRPRLLRFEHQHHLIFYHQLEGGIFIVRILHERMDPAQHLTN